MPDNSIWPRRIAVATVALTALASFLIPGAADHLEYSRPLIAAGEWWRMLTGHITHFTANHLLWDLSTMIVLGGIVAHRSIARFWWTLLGSALAISIAIFLWLPDLNIYRGLSGVDSALFTCAAVLFLREGLRNRQHWKTILAAIAITAFLGKTLFELATGRTTFVQDLGFGVTPVVLAHLIGAAWGLLIGAVHRRQGTPLFDWDWLIAGN